MALVFQYGSNLSMPRINGKDRLQGAAKFKAVVRTKGKFNYGFNIWSKQGRCAAADIVEGGRMKIIGILYDIPNEFVFKELCRSGSNCLDFIENEGESYLRVKADIEDLEGHAINEEVLTYVGNDQVRRFTHKTSAEYVSHILAGLRQINAPAEYVHYIRQIIRQNNREINPDTLEF